MSRHIVLTFRKKAFTLVELLVVIGIIAVLVGILLPTLNGARRAAYTVQCSANMKQLATAMLIYIQDNKGKHPAAEHPVIAGHYPSGWWWPNELVRLNYIKSPGVSVYKRPGLTTAQKDWSGSKGNVFRCPEGIPEDYNFTGGAGDYPTDAKNNASKIGNDGACATEGFGIPSWYQLNCRNTSISNSIVPGTGQGHRVTPFMGFQSGSNTIDSIKAPDWQRNLSMVRKSAELIMIVEAADQNWYDQTESGTYPGNFMRRIGARHGKKTAGNKWPAGNAFTNIAFFDGHVGLFPTQKFTAPKDVMDTMVRETIFYVNKQKSWGK